jgi:hypothetical protein
LITEILSRPIISSKQSSRMNYMKPRFILSPTSISKSSSQRSVARCEWASARRPGSASSLFVPCGAAPATQQNSVSIMNVALHPRAQLDHFPVYTELDQKSKFTSFIPQTSETTSKLLPGAISLDKDSELSDSKIPKAMKAL